LDTPISLEQAVYLPGDDQEGIWASRWLETVALIESDPAQDTASPMPSGLGVHGDAAIILSLALELSSIEWTIRTALPLITR